MYYFSPSTSSLQPTERIGQSTKLVKSQWKSPHTASIHILDNDSLLNIFFLYRPAILDGDEGDNVRTLGGKVWNRERWWYKLAQVCQKWRNLILRSPSYLGLCLVCTCGTPVVDMLAHSPPLPLVIDYNDKYWNITEEEEEGIIVALGQRNRVRRIRLQISVPSTQKLILAIDEEYPMLEHLVVVPSTEDRSTVLMLPDTFRAQHLRHLTLRGFVLPRGTRLLTTAVDIVTFCLFVDHPSSYFLPTTLLQWISFMPQLETLLVEFSFPVSNRDVERPTTHSPIMTSVTFPNLRSFLFRGVSTYLEAVVCRISAPRLEKLGIQFFEQLTLSVPRLLHFMNTTENLRFDSTKFEFSKDEVHVEVYSREETETYPISIAVGCWHLDWQVSSVAQIFYSLCQIFSTVEHLTLGHKAHRRSSEEHNEVDRTEWRKLLRSFSNVKTLLVDQGLVKDLSCCLRLDNGELPLELLPELQKLTYSGSDDAFTSFIDTRQTVGRPVTLVHLGPYSCDICGQRFVQRHGLVRHRREKHVEPQSCIFCEFKCHPYQYRTHLEKSHPDVDPDSVPGGIPAGSRRRSRILERDLPQHFPPPTNEPFGRVMLNPGSVH